MTRVLDAEPAAPPAPSWAARLPVYYGWVNVVLASIAMSATLPGRTHGLGFIKVPLCAELGIEDLDFSVVNFWAIIIGAVVVLPIGRMIDRVGTRVTATVVATVLGVCVLAMARSSNETELAVTLTLVRGFGQGALSVVAIAMVGKWFRRRNGAAMGLFTVLLGIGFVVPNYVVKPMVSAEGWRPAWMFVGWSLIAYAALAALFSRSTPEAIGVRPDDPAVESESRGASRTLLQALLTPAFWVYTVSGTLLGLVFSAVTLDNELLMKERGFAGQAADDAQQTFLTALFLCGLPTNLVAGWLARRVPMRKLLAAGSVMLAAAVAVFPFIDSVGSVAGYGALLGISGGIITVVYFAIYGLTYGRGHLGTIQAAVQVFSVFASALGPMLLSAIRRATGGTDVFFFGCCAAALICAVLCSVVKPHQRGEA